MPHIHTEPGQHDITVSAYIIRTDGPEPLVLVHMHRKFGKLLQIGGHLELNETPWQAMAHELVEESGYTIAELEVLQPYDKPPLVKSVVVHPVPALLNTHFIGDGHFHTDLCFAFVTDHAPTAQPKEGESTDLRWLTLPDLEAEVQKGTAAKDTYTMYKAIVARCLGTFSRLPASSFSLEEPKNLAF